jgi:hypothetical protein
MLGAVAVCRSEYTTLRNATATLVTDLEKAQV